MPVYGFSLIRFFPREDVYDSAIIRANTCHRNPYAGIFYAVYVTLQKMEFSIKISLVNMTKSAENCGFGHIFKRNPYWKTSFFVQCDNWSFLAKLSAFRQSRWYSYLIMPGVRKIVKHGLKILQRMQQDLVMCTWPSCGH